MRSYEEYRHKDSNSSNIFDLAKEGELELLIAEAALNPAVDWNARDHKGYSPLMYAAYYNHLDVARWLVAQGVDVNSPDHGGSTILMGVAFKGHIEMAKLLIAAGAETKLRNALGMEALQFAQMFGRVDMAALLDAPAENFFQRKLHQIRTWFFYLTQKLQTKRSLSHEA